MFKTRVNCVIQAGKKVIGKEKLGNPAKTFNFTKPYQASYSKRSFV
jgi:hypothetical protein